MVNSLRQKPLLLLLIGYAFLMTMAMPILPHPLLFVVLGFLPIAFYFLMKFSVFVVVLFIIFSFFRIHEAIPVLIPLKIPMLLALGAIFVVGVRLVILRDLVVDWTREFSLFTLFLMVICIGMLFATNRPEALTYLKETYIKIYLMTLISYWMLETAKHKKMVLLSILVAGSVIAVITIINKFSGIGLIEGTRVTIGRHLGSALGDPNDLSLVLLFPFAYAVATFLYAKAGLAKSFGIIISLLLITAIVFTQSRGGILGIAGVMGFYGYRHIKSKALLLTISVAVLIVLMIVAGIGDRQTTQAVEGPLDASAMGRLHAWQTAWHMALDNPVFGVGLKNFYFNYFYYTQHWDGQNHVVHSTWFSVLAETGFVGFGLFMAIIVLLYKRTRLVDTLASNQDEIAVYIMCKASTPALLSFVISGTFLSQAFTWPIYLQTVIILSLHRYLQNKTQAQAKSALQNANK